LSVIIFINVNLIIKYVKRGNIICFNEIPEEEIFKYLNLKNARDFILLNRTLSEYFSLKGEYEFIREIVNKTKNYSCLELEKILNPSSKSSLKGEITFPEEFSDIPIMQNASYAKIYVNHHILKGILMKTPTKKSLERHFFIIDEN